MTTFYQLEGMATVVWDAERNCALCEFTNRQLSTEDPRVIAKLKELGYPTAQDKLPPQKAVQVAQIDEINQHVDDGSSPQEIAEQAAKTTGDAEGEGQPQDTTGTTGTKRRSRRSS